MSDVAAPIPDVMILYTRAEVVEGVANTAEMGVMTLARSMNLLRGFVAAHADSAHEGEQKILARLYGRSSVIERALALVASEKHEGHYKTLAFQSVLIGAPGREYARSSLGLPDER